MPHILRNRSWSTPALVGISVGLSMIAFLGGRATSSVRRDLPDQAAPAASAPRPDVATASGLRSSAPAGTDDCWQHWSAGRRTPASEREMAAYLEDLATRDPQRAMALALGERNYRLSQDLRAAVLRGWAAVSPNEAAAWAQARPNDERQLAMAMVFAGAARHPEEAVKLAARLSTNEPELAGDYGQFLITGLTEAGAYEAAVRFATDDKTGHSDVWLNSAFSQWASHQPDYALAAFGKISDPQARTSAFQGMILGWAMANPAEVTAYAERLAPGEDRALAMSQALPQWASHDSPAASEWMLAHFGPSADLDAGVAAVATMPNLLDQRPEIAVGWAENIAEPVLRANTLRMIAQRWMQQDSAAIQRFIASTPGLLAIDRMSLMDGINPPPDSSSEGLKRLRN
jgi:hypothetical protein